MWSQAAAGRGAGADAAVLGIHWARGPAPTEPLCLANCTVPPAVPQTSGLDALLAALSI